jgi:voltage-gated potassium channel
MPDDEHPRRRRHSYVHDVSRHAVRKGRVFPMLAAVTVALAVGAGFLVTVIDRKDFPTFGDGVWWAIVTLGTVGYGDIVPHTGWGRVVGSVVIVFGVTFLAFLTATVTSYFVEAEQEERQVLAQEQRDAAAQTLERIEQRLAAIEEKLGP